MGNIDLKKQTSNVFFFLPGIDILIDRALGMTKTQLSQVRNVTALYSSLGEELASGLRSLENHSADDYRIFHRKTIGKP